MASRFTELIANQITLFLLVLLYPGYFTASFHINPFFLIQIFQDGYRLGQVICSGTCGYMLGGGWHILAIFGLNF